MKFIDQWDDLLRLPPWTPLDQVPFEATHIAGVLYQLSNEAFLSALPRGKDLQPVDVPRVTVVLWAENLGVARRVLLREREADVNEIPAVPPNALLPTSTRFDDVLKYCEAKVGERLRLGTTVDADGHLLTSISQSGMEFIFREQSPTNDSPVVAIMVRLISNALKRA